MSEKVLQQNVEALAKQMGILCYHTYDSRRSQPGFPDLVLVGASGVKYRELKSRTGILSPDQRYWLAALTAAGADVEVWRPVDWPTRIVNQMHELGRTTAERPLPTQAELRRKIAGTKKATPPKFQSTSVESDAS